MNRGGTSVVHSSDQTAILPLRLTDLRYRVRGAELIECHSPLSSVMTKTTRGARSLAAAFETASAN